LNARLLPPPCDVDVEAPARPAIVPSPGTTQAAGDPRHDGRAELDAHGQATPWALILQRVTREIELHQHPSQSGR
jgi:hypothetical protein